MRHDEWGLPLEQLGTDGVFEVRQQSPYDIREALGGRERLDRDEAVPSVVDRVPRIVERDRLWRDVVAAAPGVDLLAPVAIGRFFLFRPWSAP